MNENNQVVDPLNKCKDCTHLHRTPIWDECHHPSSVYTALGRQDFHTIGHMRDHTCGPSAVLFQRS